MARFEARLERLEQRLLLSVNSRLSSEVAKLAQSPSELSSLNTPALTRVLTDESGENVYVEMLVSGSAKGVRNRFSLSV